MAHGYFKAEGKPMAVLCHGTVGMQHAAMAIYNAYCDRVPVYILAGNSLDATLRRPGVEWAHSVQDAAAMVRDFIKWDDLPISLPHFAESAVRAYKIAMTPPMMPVLLVARWRSAGRSDLARGQLAPAHPEAHAARRRRRAIRVRSPKRRGCSSTRRTRSSSPTAPRAHLPASRSLIELAETLQAPVVNQGGRMNFPSRHPLNQTSNARQLVANADVILGLELTDFWGTVERVARCARAHVEVDRQAGNEADQHHRPRSRHQGQLPGLPALSRKWTSRWPPTPKPRCRR